MPYATKTATATAVGRLFQSQNIADATVIATIKAIPPIVGVPCFCECSVTYCNISCPALTFFSSGSNTPHSNKLKANATKKDNGLFIMLLYNLSLCTIRYATDYAPRLRRNTGIFYREFLGTLPRPYLKLQRYRVRSQ